MAKTYEAMQKKSISGYSGESWQFLDLKSKKQTGDLEKKIIHFKKKHDYKVFNFSSSRGQEGVSTILSNLLNYMKLHKYEKKILVIDANFQRPDLHKIFNIPNDTGLSNILNKNENIEDVSTQIKSTSITVLTAGQDYKHLSGNIEQELFSNLLDKFKDKYDLILIDSAPILSSSDAFSTSASADVTFIVIRSLKTPKEVALKTKSLLYDNECKIGGVILNDVQQVIPEWIYNSF